jgi:signal transduction histidine kinase
VTGTVSLAPLLADVVGEGEWFALLDRDLRCVHLQRGLLGGIPETLIGVSSAEASADALSAQAREIAGAVIAGGSPQETELACLDPRFGPRRFEFEFRPVRAGAEVVGVLVRSIESTDRRSHARAMRLRSRLLESMSDAVMVLDARRVIRDANPACDALFGRRTGGLVGEPLAALGEALRSWVEGARDAIPDDPTGLEVTLALGDGGGAPPARTVRCRISTLEFADERHDVLVMQDVTELQRLERDVVEAERRERERLARDMHDGLGQELTAVALMLRALEAERHWTTPDGRVHIQRLVEMVNGLIRSTRAMASGIFARPAEEIGLPAALQALAGSAAQRSGLPVDCRIDLQAEFPLRADQADHLYRIAQEAVTNALRHAQATRISIELVQDERDLRLSIRDDGRGLRATREATGLGLRIMCFRAQAAGGELRIEPDLPRGTRVEFRATVRVPTPAAAPAEGGVPAR